MTKLMPDGKAITRKIKMENKVETLQEKTGKLRLKSINEDSEVKLEAKSKSLPGQNWYEGSLYFESAQRDAEVSIKVTDSAPDDKAAKKIIFEALMEIAEGMEWFVKNNKRDIKIKKK